MRTATAFFAFPLSALMLCGCIRKESPRPDTGSAVHKSDEAAVWDESDTAGVRHYTFTANRSYQIAFRLKKSDIDAAEKILKDIDMEAYSGRTGSMFGLTPGGQNFNLLYWRGIYNSVYNRSRNTVERLASIFRRIKADENLNDAQTVYLIARFVQFMKYYIPPGVGIYSPDRTLFELGKGDETEPPSSIVTGWNGAGDCDTKSLLLVMLLQACGYRAVIFDSYRYQHAMAGVALPSADGVYLEFRGIRYYFIETTFPNWNIGQMPPQFGDLTYFYPIDPREDVTMNMNVVEAPAAVPGRTVIPIQGPSERESNNDMQSADTVSTFEIKGVAGEDDPVDWYRLAGQEGTYAAFTILYGDDMEMGAEVYNEGSKIASTADTGSKYLAAPIPGLCHLKVYRLKGSGTYNLHIIPGGNSENEPNDSKNYPSIAAGNSVLGSIDRIGDVDWFAFKGQEGYNATYKIHSDKGNAVRFEIYNDDAMICASKGEEVTAEHPGRVMAKLWSQGGTGWYILTLSRNK